MRINELAEKYGTDKRTIDYWTNLNLIRSTQLQNGYRDYGVDAEEDIKKALIIDAMGIVGEKRKEYFKLLDYLPVEEWQKVVIDKIEDERSKVSKKFDDALKYTNILMGS